MVQMHMVAAINSALDNEMQRDKNVVLLGEDVGVNGGVFRVTDGLFKKYGADRVVDTPLAELSIVGLSIGMAAAGLKPVAEIQFSGFTYASFEQLVSHAARIRYRSGGKFTCPMVLRSPCGGGIHALELHSESNEAIYSHMPGLKVVIPSGPYEAKGLLISAIRSKDPVLFFEPMKLYRAFREEVPETPYEIPLGKANLGKEGKDVTIISWSTMYHVSMLAAKKMEEENGVSCEVIDLRTINPIDTDTIINSVKKTGRVVIVHEGPRNAGMGAEISAQITEKAMLSLHAPPIRVTGYDTPYPFYKTEKFYLPDIEKVIIGINKAMNF
ncbi:MAG: alpha-ketoacid dehydrogenase subunit beta [Candidatus Aenigmarchaeota archaeon]|nr:alpha-ketoacid dehydrogenase subunit beta [Candidatus Aenigmarchaeota archaeon]